MGRPTKEQTAIKRAKEAELQTILRTQQLEAADAFKAERDLYIAFLSQESGLEPRKIAVLSALALSGIVTKACMMSGVPLRTYFDWCNDDPEFKQLTEISKEMSADRLEQVAIDLATGAYMRPLVSQGRVAAYERIYDTKALLALLKARKPREFAQRIDVTSNGHSLVKLVDKETWDSV